MRASDGTDSTGCTAAYVILGRRSNSLAEEMDERRLRPPTHGHTEPSRARRQRSTCRWLLALAVCLAPVSCKNESTTEASEAPVAAVDDDGSPSPKKQKKKNPKKSSKAQTSIDACDACTEQHCADAARDACYALGLAHERGTGVPFDLAARNRVMDRACEHGHARACRVLAWAYQDGVEVQHDDPKASTLHAKACEAGDGFACIQRGLMHHWGGLGIPDDEAARTWFSRGMKRLTAACGAGDAEACHDLGTAHLRGWGTPADAAEAYAAFGRGCPGYPDSCVHVALAKMHGDGGMAKDTAAALQDLETRCEAGHVFACSSLGQELWLGRAVPEDLSRAASMLAHACDVEAQPIACGALGVMLERGEGMGVDVQASLMRRDRACSRRNNLACYEAAALLRAQDGPPQRIEGFLRRGCQIGGYRECRELGAHIARQRPQAARTEAVPYIEEACRRGDEQSCFGLLSAGVPLPLPKDRAKPLRAKACKQGITRACK